MGRFVRVVRLTAISRRRVEELFGPEVPCFDGGGKFALAGDGGGLHEDRGDVVVEAGDLVGVVVPVLQTERAVTVGLGPALLACVAVGGGRDGADVDEGSSARPRRGYFCYEAPTQTQRGYLVRGPLGPVIAFDKLSVGNFTPNVAVNVLAAACACRLSSAL